MLPPISRRLSSTATSAIATAAPNSSTRLAWNAVRSTVIVESPKRRPISRIRSACSRLRPNARSVAIPCSMSAK